MGIEVLAYRAALHFGESVRGRSTGEGTERRNSV
jgi:hypothetical protein